MSTARRINIDGYAIRCVPCTVQIEVPAEFGGRMLTLADADAWQAEFAGIRAQASTAEEAAEKVREQLG